MQLKELIAKFNKRASFKHNISWNMATSITCRFFVTIKQELFSPLSFWSGTRIGAKQKIMILNALSLITTINHFHLSIWNTAAQTAALAFGKTEGVEQKRQQEPPNVDLLPAELKLFPKRTYF